MWVDIKYGSKTTTCAWLKPQLAYLIPTILNHRWDMRSSESNSIMTFKRFDEFVSSFCKVSKWNKVKCWGFEIDMCNRANVYSTEMCSKWNVKWAETCNELSLQVDDKTLLASSGEGTVQSFDLRYRKPDIQSEVISFLWYCVQWVGMVAPYIVGRQITRLVNYPRRVNPGHFIYRLDRFIAFRQYCFIMHLSRMIANILIPVITFPSGIWQWAELSWHSKRRW